MFGIHRAERPGIFAAILILTACASAGASETTIADTAPTVEQPTTTTTPATTTTTRPADATPQELVGTWKAPHYDPSLGQICLGLGLNSYTNADCGSNPGGGTVSFDGDTVTFTHKMLNCPDGVGVYSWEYDGETLIFTELDPPDPCDIRRDHINGRPFTR